MKRGDYRTPWPVKCAVSCVFKRRLYESVVSLGERGTETERIRGRMELNRHKEHFQDKETTLIFVLWYIFFPLQAVVCLFLCGHSRPSLRLTEFSDFFYVRCISCGTFCYCWCLFVVWASVSLFPLTSFMCCQRVKRLPSFAFYVR